MSATMSVGVGTGLTMAGVIWLITGDYRFAARAAVCAIALLAAWSSARTDRSVGVFGLALIAVLLVTVVPIALPRAVMLWALGGCLLAIAAWLMLLERVVPTPIAPIGVPGRDRLE